MGLIQIAVLLLYPALLAYFFIQYVRFKRWLEIEAMEDGPDLEAEDRAQTGEIRTRWEAGELEWEDPDKENFHRSVLQLEKALAAGSYTAPNPLGKPLQVESLEATMSVVTFLRGPHILTPWNRFCLKLKWAWLDFRAWLWPLDDENDD